MSSFSSHYHTLRFALYLKEGLFMLAPQVLGFFFLFIYPLLAWGESDSEEFPSTGLSLSRRLLSDSRFRWNVGASPSVTCKNPIPIYFWEIQQISFQSGILVAHRDKTCAIRLEMRRQVRIIACTTKHFFSFLHSVQSPLWKCSKRNV